MMCDCGNDKRFEKVWFIEDEYQTVGGRLHKTCRARKAVSHLVCLECGRNHCVDDSFDRPWYRK